MNYIIIKDDIIENIIVSDEPVAKSIGAKPYYNSAAIGKRYNPPTLDDLQKQIDTQNSQTACLAETMCNLLYELDKKELGVKK